MYDQGFEGVIGHQDIIRHLKNAISSGKVSQAYLFAGEKGSGKKMLANLFAMRSAAASGMSFPRPPGFL